MKTSFRTFWSYRMESTEKWLQTNQAQGYELVSINPLLRIFYFQQTSPTDKTFKMLYKTSQLSKSLIEEGWELKQLSKNWYITSTDQPNPINVPSSENLINRFGIHNLIFIVFFFFMLITTFIFFILFDATNARIGSALVLNFTIMNILIVSSNIYDRPDESLMNITKDENNEIEDFAESHSKWLYLPVTTEKLLQEMDQKGYRLLRADNMFYFKKNWKFVLLIKLFLSIK